MLKAIALLAITTTATAVKLQSGHDLSTAELNIGAADPAKFIAGTVYYSSTNLDNLVAATAETKKFAESNNYGVYAPVETFEAVAAASGSLPIKTFWSSKLKDTLTTASEQGLAWAANPDYGYTFMRIEGYCTT
eukprot:gene8449-22095_t